MNELKLGKYQHFKGEIIEVLCVALNSETLEKYAVYKTLSGNETYEKGTVWVRPLKMFEENVKLNGKEIPRFKFVG